jgi:hypothetical protein
MLPLRQAQEAGEKTKLLRTGGSRQFLWIFFLPLPAACWPPAWKASNFVFLTFAPATSPKGRKRHFKKKFLLLLPLCYFCFFCLCPQLFKKQNFFLNDAGKGIKNKKLLPRREEAEEVAFLKGRRQGIKNKNCDLFKLEGKG